jgi:hypothetical protein
MTQNKTAPLYVFDSLGSINYPELEKSVQVVAGDSDIAATGWALDGTRKTTAGGVDVVFDQVPYSARYGIPRGDVADHFKRSDYTNSGFQLILGRERLTKGQHSIAIRVIFSDQKTYSQGPVVKFTVN